MLLEVRDLHVFYGRIEALKGISFSVNQGEIVTLIGANGAGKTTTMRTVSGVRSVAQGSIIFEGQDITKMPPHERVKLGICQAPEGRGIFPGMTVRENLDMGTYVDRVCSCCGQVVKRTNAEKASDLEHVFTLFPRLKERITQLGGTLSGGEQQMLAIGRALMSRPRLLLLDEPSMGLAPMLIAQIFEIIKQINSEGISVLLVEQNATQALRTAQRGYVLETGHVVKEGSGQLLLDDPAVRAAYLGG